jgi:3-hydroxyisobutyrate dehydrogenase
MTTRDRIGFIGLGVMGEPICRNMIAKSGCVVTAFDVAPEPLARIKDAGGVIAATPADAAVASNVVFLCLPSGRHVEDVFRGRGRLLDVARTDQVFVDLGTSPVALARDLARELANRGAVFADAPIARTREAAQTGTLSVMVGAARPTFEQLEPLIRCFASDITHCGDVGTGQIAKIMNNMVLFQTVNALAEALAVGTRAGIDPAVLLSTLAKGSANSFALNNHGMKAMLPGHFPERAFSTEYALKDNSYALALAQEVGVRLRGAELTAAILEETIAAGYGANYFPVLKKIIDRKQ